MIRGQSVGIVIPCHNEEEGLASLFPRLPAAVDEVVVVDNNSRDRTAAVARAHGARVIFEHEPGYGRAYQAGFRAATADIVVTMDGDGQYPIEEVPRMVNEFLDRKLDCLSGSRFPLGGAAMPWLRRFGNALLTGAARVLFGARMRDTQSGMWLFRRALLNRVLPTQPSMSFSEEFKLKVILAGGAFGETHIPYVPRLGKSTLRPFQHGWENLAYLVRLRFETLGRAQRGAAIRLRHPVPEAVKEMKTARAHDVRAAGQHAETRER